MKAIETDNLLNRRSQGFALLVTLLVLVVLAFLVAGLGTRLTMAKRRQQYMIEYQRARYGLDSGIKYILSEMPHLSFSTQSREDVPDFSDLFWMNRAEYDQSISAWAATATDEQLDSVLKEDATISQTKSVDTAGLLDQLAALFGGGDDAVPATADPNDFVIPEGQDVYVVEIDPNDIQVPGPYGPPWPYIVDPIEMDIGPCRVTITIEDENAKMPLSWLITTYPEDDPRGQYVLETFGEWMQMLPEEIKALKEQCDLIYQEKPFRLNAGPILVKKNTAAARNSAASRFRASRRRTRPQSAAAKQTATEKRPAIAHTTDFAKLFHSSLLNRETLAEPIPDTGQRVESPLKYLGLWGSQRVNINTAPRHVLQAAFMQALTWDEAVTMADEVIAGRREKPFPKIDALKEIGLLDEQTFNKLKAYVTTRSTFFKITVTSTTGNARSDAVLTVVREGRQAENLMVLYDQL